MLLELIRQVRLAKAELDLVYRQINVMHTDALGFELARKAQDYSMHCRRLTDHLLQSGLTAHVDAAGHATLYPRADTFAMTVTFEDSDHAK